MKSLLLSVLLLALAPASYATVPAGSTNAEVNAVSALAVRLEAMQQSNTWMKNQLIESQENIAALRTLTLILLVAVVILGIVVCFIRASRPKPYVPSLWEPSKPLKVGDVVHTENGPVIIKATGTSDL